MSSLHIITTYVIKNYTYSVLPLEKTRNYIRKLSEESGRKCIGLCITIAIVSQLATKNPYGMRAVFLNTMRLEHI